MKRFLLAGVTVVLTTALAAPAFAQDAAKVERGMKVFADQKCSLCHSIGDKGNKKGPLDGVGSKLKADEIESWLKDPKAMAAKTGAKRMPPMKAFTDLSKEDMDALVTYLLSLKK